MFFKFFRIYETFLRPDEQNLKLKSVSANLIYDLFLFICPEFQRTYIATVPKILFLPIVLKLFSPRFGPLELSNCNKNFVCLSSFCLSVCLIKLVTGLAVTVLVLFVWNLVHLCIYWIPKDTQKLFLKFLFFRFLLDFWYFWDLANFWGEIQTTSKSNFCGFHGVDGSF